MSVLTVSQCPLPASESAESAEGTDGAGGRRAALLLVGCGFALLPWLVVLAGCLPATATAAHWRTAWIGLDSMEAVGLAATGILALRGHRGHAVTAVATATLLTVDAWFDTTTAVTLADRVSAVAMAVGAELPLAAVCVALAIRAPGGTTA